MKIVDLVYHCHHEFQSPEQVLDKHRPTLAFIEYLPNDVAYTVVRHINYKGFLTRNGVQYAFFTRNNQPWQIPVATHRYIRSIRPDIVLIHGFVFPLQVIALKKVLGRHCAIILEHHAEQPMPSIRRSLQTIADRSIDRYIFSADALAVPWILQGVISDINKVVAVMASSVMIEKKDRNECKAKTGLTGVNNFLWVGRLTENKDPVTVLKAFTSFLQIQPDATLSMIYQTDECLPTVKAIIADNPILRDAVRLIGKIANRDLADWYNAADFFISASRSEAAGYALMEAMSVGCIPIVTAIPSYRKLVSDGHAGYLFQPRDAAGLLKALTSVANIDRTIVAARVEKHFADHWRAKKVASNMYELFKQLQSEKIRHMATAIFNTAR